MANVAYIRVSTVEQNEARQLEAMKAHQIDKTFIDKVSGKDTNRPQLKAMMDYVREGDTVFIHDFSRLARSTKDLLIIIDNLHSRGVKIISHKEDFDITTPHGRFMLIVSCATNELEYDSIRERQREGIAIAKAEGKYKGRKAREVDQEFIDLYGRYLKHEINKVQMAKQLDVSRPTLDKMIDLYKKQLIA